MKSEPLSSSLSTLTSPLCNSTNDFTNAKPMPVPLAAPLAWKKRSNTLLASSLSIPLPVSRTSIRSLSPMVAISTKISPPAGVYFNALLRRLNTTRAIFSLSATIILSPANLSLMKCNFIFLRSAVSLKSPIQTFKASTISKRTSLSSILPFWILRKSRMLLTNCCKAMALRCTVFNSSRLLPLMPLSSNSISTGSAINVNGVRSSWLIFVKNTSRELVSSITSSFNRFNSSFFLANSSLSLAFTI